MTLEEKVLAQRLFVMRRAQELGNAAQACGQPGVSGTLFYRWRRYQRLGADRLKRWPPRRARLRQQAPAVVSYARLWPTHGPARIARQSTREEENPCESFGCWQPH